MRYFLIVLAAVNVLPFCTAWISRAANSQQPNGAMQSLCRTRTDADIRHQGSSMNAKLLSSSPYTLSKLFESADGIIDSDGENEYENHVLSLVGNYVVAMESSDNTHRMVLRSIPSVVNGLDILAEGAQAQKALTLPWASTTMISPSLVLECTTTWAENECPIAEVKLHSNTDNDQGKDLMMLLSGVLAQWSMDKQSKNASEKVQVTFDLNTGEEDVDETTTMTIDLQNLTSNNELAKLFPFLGDPGTLGEWVEMVDQRGYKIGRIPRRAVHSFNILHRGIGLFVTKDRPINLPTNDDGRSKIIPTNSFPHLYVHRRTSTKRIFPSLYDMFVGGVSLAGEKSAATARREVAEELGLTKALDDEAHLSPPLLDCIVCTSYNRCFVTLYSYVMDTNNEKISWQEEEVEWGNFVPYNIIAASAEMSKQRLIEQKEWPGTYQYYPPVQLGSKSDAELLDDANKHDDGDESYSSNDHWNTWDYVPDGLLVWEAWLQSLTCAAAAADT